MNFLTIILISALIESSFVHFADAKRSFGLTRSRSKNKSPNVRRGERGHEFDDVPAPKATEGRKMSQNNQQAPQGPPPAYPGLGHQSVPHHNAPPAYNPSYGSQSYQHYPSGIAPHPSGLNTFGSPSAGVVPMGVMPIAYQQPQRSGNGMMTNLFAGLAGYQLARAFSGSGHHHAPEHEVIIIDNRQQPPPGDVSSLPDGELPLNMPKETSTHQHMMVSSTEIPREPQAMQQGGPAHNDYNYYQMPQYGIPLYGYNMPTQHTSYQNTEILNIPPQQQQQQQSQYS